MPQGPLHFLGEVAVLLRLASRPEGALAEPGERRQRGSRGWGWLPSAGQLRCEAREPAPQSLPPRAAAAAHPHPPIHTFYLHLHLHLHHPHPPVLPDPAWMRPNRPFNDHCYLGF